MEAVAPWHSRQGAQNSLAKSILTTGNDHKSEFDVVF